MRLFEKSTRICIILAVIMLFAAPAFSCDKIKGWGNMFWGTPFEEVKDGLIEVKSDIFTIKGVDIELAVYFKKDFPVPDWLEQPYFVFLNGKFAATAIFVKDDVGLSAFAMALIEQCGEPMKTEDQLIWLGDHTMVVLDKEHRLVLLGDPTALIVIEELLSN